MVHSNVALSRINASPVIQQDIQCQILMGLLDFVLIGAIIRRLGECGILAEKGPLSLDPAKEQPDVFDHSGRNTQFLGPHW